MLLSAYYMPGAVLCLISGDFRVEDIKISESKSAPLSLQSIRILLVHNNRL